MRSSKRRKREQEIANSQAIRRFKKHARKLELYVHQRVGVNAATLDDAIELLDEAHELLTEMDMKTSYSSSPETGVYLIVCR